MTAKRARSTAGFGEDSIVRMLGARFGARSRLLERGIGDDAAVLTLPGTSEKFVVTTDTLVEEIDFRRAWQTPEQLGWRSLAVNISDLAAMGVRPRFHLVALGIPGGIGESWIRGFYRGLASAGARFGSILIGGDLSRTPAHLVITITALGESLHKRILYRSGGRAGDALYVTGFLGAAAAGLALLERGKVRASSASQRRALAAHRAPMPRCETGLWLAQSGFAGAMMDLSDGLSMDLPRLCEASSTGGEVWLSRLPLFQEAASWGCSPVELALHGAEDFELLFSIRENTTARFETTYPHSLPAVTRIGRLTRGRTVACVTAPGEPGRPLPAGGFDHFLGKKPQAGSRKPVE